MASYLTTAEIELSARHGNWKFEVYNRLDPHIDSAVGPGDGVDDLDRLVDRLARFPTTAVYLIDPLPQSTLKRQVSATDLTAIRDRFVELYGEVDKINEYATGPSSAIQY